MIVQVKTHEHCYIKDPDTSLLGKKIIGTSITLIDEIGLEAFTFKKLASRINSTEASIYRYFENKHKLLIYLVSWYWSWLDFRFTFASQNISCPKKKLEIFVEHITHPVKVDPTFEHIDEVALHRIVISESSKSYLTKDVDSDNKEGYFFSFQNLIKDVGKLILEVNPNYSFPTALVSTLIESAHFQRFFGEHLSSITESNSVKKLEDFLKQLLFSTIRKE